MSSTQAILKSDTVTKAVIHECVGTIAEQLRFKLAELAQALAASSAEPDDESLRTTYEQARRGLALGIAKWPKRDRDGSLWSEVQSSLAQIEASGAQDFPLSQKDGALLANFNIKDWPGLVAMMVLAPSWRCHQAPLLADVPEAWRISYTNWLFTPPKGFTALGDAELYAQHSYKHLQELEVRVQKDPGSVIKKADIKIYLHLTPSLPLTFLGRNLPALAELRGAVLNPFLTDRSAA
jgi:hypothetical protein